MLRSHRRNCRPFIPTNHITHNLAIKGLYQSVLERGPRADIANHATFGHAAHFTVEIISLESTLIKNGTQELSQTTGGSKLAPVALDCTTFHVGRTKGSRPSDLGSLGLSGPGGLTIALIGPRGLYIFIRVKKKSDCNRYNSVGQP